MTLECVSAGAFSFIFRNTYTNLHRGICNLNVNVILVLTVYFKIFLVIILFNGLVLQRLILVRKLIHVDLWWQFCIFNKHN